ncbi:hypothetical protein PoB_000075100 [Plakobranchus ocellatus]|uniref:Uncharacterized protein n=1 Tax=Plakobranchus ocellatus TaxID=259542 RepID=A0AAV3XW09_9GAST|nr:hypothetical protein PoB_000075100 [Plakobranchus ocellatus]
MSCWILVFTVIYFPITIDISLAFRSGVSSNKFEPYSVRAGSNHISTSTVTCSRNVISPENGAPRCPIFISTEKWTRLFLEGRVVIDYMYDMHTQNQSSHLIKLQTFVYIYTSEILPTVNIFVKTMSSNTKAKIIVFEMAMLSSRQNVLDILLSILDMEAHINGVVVASSHMDFIYLVLDTVGSEAVFKWRRFRHTIEWIAMTVDLPTSNGKPSSLRQKKFPDFFTLLSMSERDGFLNLDLAQKSRNESIETGPRLSFRLKSLSFGICQQGDLSSSEDQQPLRLLNLSLLPNPLRKNAALYLSTQKSVMAGMHIPTVFLVSEPDRTAFVVTDGNETRWEGFNVAVMNLLSEALGFTGIPFAVADGGFYGLSGPNGDILGVTGTYV